METHSRLGMGPGGKLPFGNEGDSREKGIALLEEGKRHWTAHSTFRAERTRNKNYTFGRQWSDMITVGGCRMTEHDYIVSEGNIPLKNNLIRRIVRNVLGVFRRQLAEKMETWDEPLKTIAAQNSLYELYARTMEEFLISGLAVERISVEKKNGVCLPRAAYVSPESFFFDTSARDIRGNDLSVIGQFHEIRFADYCDAFVRSRHDYEKARSLYETCNKVKLMEIWRHERVPRYLIHDRRTGRVIKTEETYRDNSRQLCTLPSKWILDDVWRYYFIDMEGNILCQGDSPYPHKSHPYALKCYPFLDGEIHGFVADIIDQQRYTNRLITMYDWIMRASAKGVLLMPEGAVDSDRMQEVVDQWSRFNGVIVYKPKVGQPDPRQVSGNATNIGISELLDIQLKMIEDISGVNGALQGKLSTNSMSGTLYNQQTQNALTSLSDLLDTFGAFINNSNSKLMTTVFFKNRRADWVEQKNRRTDEQIEMNRRTEGRKDILG